MTEQSFDFIDVITDEQTQAWFKAAGLEGKLPVKELTNDQQISQFMLKNGLTKFRVPLVKNIDNILLYYAENKEEIDAELTKSLQF